MINEQEFSQLLNKYRNGNCTKEEIQLIDHYLENQQDSPDNDLVAQNLIESTFEKISSTIDDHETLQLNRKKGFRTIIKIAASILLFISVSLVVYNNQAAIYSTLNPLTYTSIEAKAGKNITINLPDGSIIQLNQRSKLTYSNRFNEKLREVSLIGEAYFQVAKDKNKPFIVHTGKLNTRVLGTSFNIEAYPFSKIVAIQLITGKIWLNSSVVKSNRVNTILLPNQAVMYDTVSGLAEKHNVLQAENYNAWKDGKVRFSNTLMSEVVRRLNISFRSNIILTDKALANKTLYGEFNLYERPEAIVKAICMLIKADYIIKPTGEIAIRRYPIKQSLTL